MRQLVLLGFAASTILGSVGPGVAHAETTLLNASYEPTRRFYARQGYELASRLADFYADGDDLIVFRKRFLPVGPPR